MHVVDIYCRVSTDAQVNNSYLEEQEEACRQYCQEHGLAVGVVHHEVFSGYQYRERPKLDLMRQRYRDKNIQGVVIRTVDRLSRNQTHIAVLMDEMEHHGVTLHCAKEKIDDSALGRFVVAALALVAEMEREKIMDRSTMGRVSKARAGKIVSGSKAPYGWDWIYDERGEKTVVTNTDQARIVRRIAEQYAAGVAANAIMGALNAEGIPSPNGMAWTTTTILRLICDSRIIGKGRIFAYQNRKTKKPLAAIDLPDGTYPAIISEELFQQIMERREANRAEAIRANADPEQYLLRAGFVRCAYCDRPMAAIKHRQHHIYRCLKAIGEHGNTILAHALDEKIWQWLQQLADHVELIEQAVQLATSSTKIQQDTAALERSIQTWKAKATRYLEDLRDESLVGDTRTAIRNELNAANKMVARLEEEKAQVMAGMIDKEREQAAYEDILAWCKKVKTSREELTYQQKRDFLRMLGVVVLVENKYPFYDHLLYRVEIRLPAIQELLSPYGLCNSDTPLPEDVKTTEQLVQAGKHLDIEVLDHIIIGHQRFISMKERNLGF